MKRAVELAREAAEHGEIPVGAVIVKNGEIIAEGRNFREEKQNALSHAETEAINSACKALGSWRLDGCTMYVTLEPCFMCAGAIVNSRISTLVFGAYDLKAGFIDSAVNVNSFEGCRLEVYGGICEDECSELISSFFEKNR